MDTGGLFGATTDPLHALVVEHGLKALESADVFVFVLDAREGLVPGDEDIAQRLRATGNRSSSRSTRPMTSARRARALEFHRMGFDSVFEVSAEHGDGVYELLDEIAGAAARGRPRRPDAEADELSIAFVGRPNVGKSSLVNRLLREERVMVSEMPGTTRDTVDAVMNWRKRQLRILDTAGMRRPGRVAAGGAVEAVSVVLSRRAMAAADVVVLVVDATEGAGDREGAIAGEAEAPAAASSSPSTSGTSCAARGRTGCARSTTSSGFSSSSWTTRRSSTSRRSPANTRRGCSRSSTGWAPPAASVSRRRS